MHSSGKLIVYILGNCFILNWITFKTHLVESNLHRIPFDKENMTQNDFIRLFSMQVHHEIFCISANGLFNIDLSLLGSVSDAKKLIIWFYRQFINFCFSFYFEAFCRLCDLSYHFNPIWIESISNNSRKYKLMTQEKLRWIYWINWKISSNFLCVNKYTTLQKFRAA